MERFLNRHANRVTGSISGFDRMVFRATLPYLSHAAGMEKFLGSQKVLLKDFGHYLEGLSAGIKKHAEQIAEAEKRPVQYVASSAESKEKIAQQIAERDGIRSGLICVLTCVEPCKAFEILKDRKQKLLRVVKRDRKCLHVYFYYLDREFGLMHIRLQTWAPFTMQIYVNGREWLARQLDRAGVGYHKHDNCLTQVEDLLSAAQQMERLNQYQWPTWLNRIARIVNPYLRRSSPLQLHGYYWTLHQAEYATDILFRDGTFLKQIYPALIRHALDHFASSEVLRFLGRRMHVRLEGEVRTHLGRRVEGVRIKHWVEENSIKMYDKAGSVLRIETTINNTKRFKVRRCVTRHGRKVFANVQMRKGVVDIRRRVQLCMAANARYLDALAVVADTTPSHRILDSVSKPVVSNNRRYRPLRPICPDESRFLQEIARGEYLIQGFRNRDLRQAIFPDREADLSTRRWAAGVVTRRLQLLRSHGLTFRVPKTNYYRLTEKGHAVIATALRFRITDMALFSMENFC